MRQVACYGPPNARLQPAARCLRLAMPIAASKPRHNTGTNARLQPAARLRATWGSGSSARRAQRRAQLVPPSLVSHGPEPAAIFITRRSASTTNAATERRDQDAATKPHCRGKLHEGLPVATTWRTSAVGYTPKNQSKVRDGHDS